MDAVKRLPLQMRGRGCRLILPLLFLAVLTVSLDAQEDFQRRVAVLDFEAVGVSRDLAIEAQNAVERALYDVRGLQLIERGRIDLILREQEMQLSDLADQDTAVEVGRLLAANTVVTGVVTRPEAPWLTVKVLDVETGAVLFVGDASVGRSSLMDTVARRLARGAEKILFPERYEPLLMSLGGCAQMAVPFTDLADLVTVGAGASAFAELENLGLNNLVFGLRMGLLVLPGQTDNTKYLMNIPISVSAGYRWDVFKSMFVQPTIIAGAAANILSWDPDGYVVGFDEPEYEVEAEVVPLAGAGISIGYPTRSWNLKLDIETLVMFERNARIIILSVNVGVYRLIYNSRERPKS
jgi:hypothetical protein